MKTYKEQFKDWLTDQITNKGLKDINFFYNPNATKCTEEQFWKEALQWVTFKKE